MIDTAAPTYAGGRPGASSLEGADARRGDETVRMGESGYTELDDGSHT